MAIDLTVESVKGLSEVGFLFVFAIASLAGVAILARYIAKVFQQKDNQVTEERKLYNQLFAQLLEVVKNNTDAFKDMTKQLSDLMQEGRLHHKDVMNHLSVITGNSPLYQRDKAV